MIRSLVGRARRLAGRTVDRALHPRRRALALERLRAVAAPRTLLFVCHGNICRSPYAEGAFRMLIRRSGQGGTAVSSAGFLGPNRPAPATAIAVAGRRGVDLTGHRSRLLSHGLLEGVDLVVVMNAAQAREVRRMFRVREDRVLVLGDIDPGPVERREIRDPVDQPEAVFEAVYRRIDACLGVLAEVVARA